jgi:hypothetical protein
VEANFTKYDAPIEPLYAQIPVVRKDRSPFTLLCFGIQPPMEGQHACPSSANNPMLLAATRQLDPQSELYVPPSELVNVDRQKLLLPAYQEILAYAMDKIQNSNRYDHLYSWYGTNRHTPNFVVSHFNLPDEIIPYTY